ncbi:hypothetical protein ACFWXB_14275 [Tsukamurella tyrosinosolvens]|uniref:hypothetical protein n=1 Tax=Tsukamurella tyrosinosolvens TaxID=57704 RepID=UPI0036B12171
MRKQWGLFIGAVGFYAAALGLIHLAGPDPYPRTYSRGRVTSWTSRSAFVENQVESLAVALLVGALLFFLVVWRPWWLKRRANRAYWTTRLQDYRRIMTTWILRLASIGAFGFGLGHVATVVLPSSAAGRTALAWAIAAALLVEVIRGALQLRPSRDQRANDVPVPSGITAPDAEGTWPARP